MPSAGRFVAGWGRSVNAIAIDLPAGSEPKELGTLLVTNRSGPGVRKQAGADPGRDCRIVSGPRSRTNRRFLQRVSEHVGATESSSASDRMRREAAAAPESAPVGGLG